MDPGALTIAPMLLASGAASPQLLRERLARSWGGHVTGATDVRTRRHTVGDPSGYHRRQLLRHVAGRGDLVVKTGRPECTPR